MALKKITEKTTGNKIQVESAIRDAKGQIIHKSYAMITDLSSDITDVAGLTYDIKKAYKIGNVIILTIYAANNTGSTITADTTLFRLSNNLQPSVNLITYARIPSYDTTIEIGATGVSGNCSIPKDLGTSEVLRFTVSYAIA